MLTKFKDILTKRDKNISRSGLNKCELSMLKGHIDLIEKKRIAGWCCDTSDLDLKLPFNILINDQLVATSIANGFRPDLKDAGFGNGYHAFDIEIKVSWDISHQVVKIQDLKTNKIISQKGIPLRQLGDFTGIDFTPEKRVGITLNKKFSFNIDIINRCNLSCTDCPQSVYKPRQVNNIKTTIFKQILEKIKRECHCSNIQLFNWSEPTLNPELPDLIKLVNEHGLNCDLSSNLSLRNIPNLEKILLASPSSLVISVSGFDQEMHKRYHRGSDINVVKNNLQKIKEIKNNHGLKTKVSVHYLQFNDNKDDELIWKDYCKKNGFKFFAKQAFSSEVTTPESARRLITKPDFSNENNRNVNFADIEGPIIPFCFLHNSIPIDVEGNVSLCCIYWNHEEMKIGNYLEMPLEEIQYKRLNHEKCFYCKMGSPSP